VSESGSSAEERLAWYHHMQKTQPIRYRPEHNMWDVFRYKDVEQVLLDYDTFSIDRSLPEGFQAALGKCDPPKHRQLRSLVSKAFTPRRIEQLRPRLVRIVDELLEQASASGKMNLISVLAHLLPIHVISETLGLPPQDRERLHQWSSQLLHQLMMGVCNPDNTEILDYFSGLLNKRERDPCDDIMSGLLAAEEAAQENETPLTRTEIIYICIDLMTGGNVIITGLLSSAFKRFSQHPEIYQALRADPSLIPGTVEEMLRYDLSASSMWRTARHDTVLDGHQIRAGQYVLAWIAAANFDEAYFPHPERFDIRRSPNLHLTFGHGVHFCVGHALVRLEVRIVLERIVARFSEIRLDL
jgi:cytochrome P450 family 109